MQVSSLWEELASRGIDRFGWLYAILAVEVVGIVVLDSLGYDNAADHYVYISLYLFASGYALWRGARLAAATAISVVVLRTVIALGGDDAVLQIASLLFANLFVLLVGIYSDALADTRNRRLGTTSDRGE